MRQGEPTQNVLRGLVRESYEAGNDCAEALLAGFAGIGALPEALHLPTLEHAVAGMGAGMGGGKGPCGALGSAVVVINCCAAEKTPSTRKKYRLTRAFVDEFETCFGEVTCQSLRSRRRRTCGDLTVESAALLYRFLVDHDLISA